MDPGVDRALTDDACWVRLSARSAAEVAFWLGALDTDFEVVGPPELADACRRIADRYARATG